MTFAGFDHIDLRVRDLAAARPLYDELLPALGLIERLETVDSVEYYEPRHVPVRPRRFFGLNLDPGHVPNANRIAFTAESAADVDRLAGLVRSAGARIIEGPEILDSADAYYAVFFEDASGNRLEIAYRKPHHETNARAVSAT